MQTDLNTKELDTDTRSPWANAVWVLFGPSDLFINIRLG